MKATAILALSALTALAACSGKTTTTTTTTDTTTVASAAPAGASAAPAAAASSAPAAAAGDACALVTQAEASTAMGATAAAGIAKTDHDGYTSCRYYDPTKTKNVFVQFVDPKLADQMGPMGGKDVPGVGDKATWLSGSIFVTKGDKAAQIGLYLSANSLKAMDAAEPALAKTAADRM